MSNFADVMVKALFFDIDGTLVSFKTHRIPHSTISAIEQAKARGVRIYISTGRPLSIINNIGEIADLVDGYIATNGAYCMVGNEVIHCGEIPRRDVDTFMRLADEQGFSCMVVGEHDLAIYNGDEKINAIFRGVLNVKDIPENVPMEPILRQRILQLTPVMTEEEEARLMTQLPGCIACRWCPDFMDITAKGADKGNALKIMAAHQHIDIQETMAFGDGGNDLSIIQDAGIGVAMGNANECLKQAADYVTTSVDEDGVYNALKHFEVI